MQIEENAQFYSHMGSSQSHTDSACPHLSGADQMISSEQSTKYNTEISIFHMRALNK